MTYAIVRQLFPHLSDGGRRSFIHLLKKKHVLVSKIQEAGAVFQLSPYGELIIQKKFPFLKDQEVTVVQSAVHLEQTHCLVMGKETPHDPHFRRLKKEMARFHFIRVQRSIYFLQGSVHPDFVALCQEEYFSSVLFFALKEWHIPNSYLYFSQLHSYSDVHTALSGISKQLPTLIAKKDQYSPANDQSKMTLYSVFDELFDLSWEHQSLFEADSELRTQLLSLVKKLFAQI